MLCAAEGGGGFCEVVKVFLVWWSRTGGVAVLLCGVLRRGGTLGDTCSQYCKVTFSQTFSYLLLVERIAEVVCPTKDGLACVFHGESGSL